MPNFILAATDLHRSYALAESAVPALRGVSLQLEAGAFVAVMGPSGCGKSTLLQLCGAMDKADSGSLKLDGREVTSMTDTDLTRLRRERIGFVFQFFNLLPTLSVLENIAMPLLLARVNEKTAFEKARVLAKRVGIDHRLGHFPNQISGGEAQRAALARAVIHEPALLIADEPTGSLDSTNGQRVLELFQELNRDLGVAILMATHDAQVAAVAKQAVRMKDGRVVE
ncbi:putative ABC transport system ATP-binding protein [Prosthecobacter fusiformis]|uniref:Putative ABC transport system ATP-binding protein n=1 Tax=Prosthecobacter fusiformis TaxID=48464 RepID=A0A4R7RXE1_9BACT|nr:ABC transporter ATP-binding protein [Prosthecobacter fusiformis]TDU69217.1 putative ABC transport system ATP-binding protein [Prosthecobacter fusiformis]